MYLYKFKYTSGDEQLCMLEEKYLFGRCPSDKYLFTEGYVDVNRSPFVKYCIRVILQGNSLEELVNKVIITRLSFDSFKVKYEDVLDELEFQEKRDAEYAVGYEIIGQADVHNPCIVLGLTCINGIWYLGEYIKSTGIWHKHDHKPRKYSNSLPSIFARAVVNIASGQDKECRIIDPCCGIGTVVLEGISMGINIIGSDINYKVVRGARENLSFFGYPDVVSKTNIHEIEGHYDVAIIDLPYGIMSETSEERQLGIVSSAGRIAGRVIVVSIKDMSQLLENAGFTIIDGCEVSKGIFKRYITMIKNNE
jgi:tRNA G10  N-methylase Trm11